jgi:hypothetical protein
MAFMTSPPKTYYDMIDARLPNHGELLKELKKRGIPLDGSTEKNEPRLLLQIFSETQLGPVFFEYIQRKRDGLNPSLRDYYQTNPHFDIPWVHSGDGHKRCLLCLSGTS